MDVQASENEGRAWNSAYTIGGVAALIATGLFVIDIIVLTALGPLPATAGDWYVLLQGNRAIGLLQLFFTDIIGVALAIPIALALFASLRQVNRAMMALATALALIGVAIVMATSASYSIVYLSDQYAVATTEAHRSALLAAGEAWLATGSGTGPNMAGLFLEGGFVIASLVMLRSRAFNRWIAYLGIVAHGLDLLHFIIFLLFPIFTLESTLKVGVPLLTVGGTLELIWYPLVGLGLLRLGRRS